MNPVAFRLPRQSIFKIAVPAWHQKMVHPANRQTGIAQASRDAGPKKRGQHDVLFAGHMIFALNDEDLSFTGVTRRAPSGDLAGGDAHYFNFPTTASIFALNTGIVNGLAITLLTPSFAARSMRSLSLLPVS